MSLYKGFAIGLFGLITSCGTIQGVVTTERPTAPAPKTEPEVSVATTPSTEKSEPEPTAEVLESTSTTRVYADVVAAYVQTYSAIAQEEMRKYGIPASITLAQGILESGAGRGSLSVRANNHFGIKCHKEWTGPAVYHDDDRESECFRKYEHPNQSYEDHSLFLTQRSYYKSLFLLAKDDYVGWAKGLRQAGYATDPRYPEKLIGLIERYQLQRYDLEVLQTAAASESPVIGKTSPAPPPTDVSTVPGPPVATQTAPVSSPPAASGASEVPSETFYTVRKGDTLYSISRRNGLSVEELMRLNQLNNSSIYVGQPLRIKPLQP